MAIFLNKFSPILSFDELNGATTLIVKAFYLMTFVLKTLHQLKASTSLRAP
jgi:hypothetical protein